MKVAVLVEVHPLADFVVDVLRLLRVAVFLLHHGPEPPVRDALGVGGWCEHPERRRALFLRDELWMVCAHFFGELRVADGDFLVELPDVCALPAVQGSHDVRASQARKVIELKDNKV